MNEYWFIDKYGIDRAKRVIENVVCNGECYSAEKCSYYAEAKSHTVSIKKLKRAIKEFNEMEETKQKSARQIYEWRKKSSKGML